MGNSVSEVPGALNRLVGALIDVIARVIVRDQGANGWISKIAQPFRTVALHCTCKRQPWSRPLQPGRGALA